jgi:predicted outer membrane repeat protein
MAEYPENAVWYIEARPWNGPKDGTSCPASGQPPTQGSGVAVSIESLKDGERTTKNYLLTCAHVVRRKEDDALLEDIVCFPPGSNYVETQAGTRSAGEFDIAAHVKIGRVSKLSPCGATIAPRNQQLRDDPADDWVLIEVILPITHFACKVKQHGGSNEAAFFWKEYETIEEPWFQNLTRQTEYRVAQVDSEKLNPLRYLFDRVFRRLTLVGYAGGAQAFEGGASVKPIAPENFKARRSESVGIIDYIGPDEARPGMSGGGIFSKGGRLVGVHRHSRDSTLIRGAVSVAHIGEWLPRERKGSQLHDPGSPVWKKFWRKCLQLVGAGMASALLILWVMLDTGSICDVCSSSPGLSRTIQLAWHTNNLHLLRPALNANRIVETFPETIRCYQEIALTKALGDSQIRVNHVTIIPEGATLKVASGISLLFETHAGIIVRGTLSAIGTPDAPVRFSAIDHDAGWRGIAIDGGSGCTFENCIIEFGRGHRYQFTAKANDLNSDGTPKPNTLAADGVEAGGAISIHNARDIKFNHVRFLNNSAVAGGAGYINGSQNVEFWKCLFSKNLAFSPKSSTASDDKNRRTKGAPPGGGVFMQLSHNIDFVSCVFEENYALGNYSCGGAIYSGFGASCNIKDCEFRNNVSANSGGGIYAISSIPEVNGTSFPGMVERLGQPKLRVTESRFEDNASLLHTHGALLHRVGLGKLLWAYNGFEVAVDDGVHVDFGQTTIVNRLGGKRLVHADDPFDSDSVQQHRTQLRVHQCRFESLDPVASQLQPFDGDGNSRPELSLSEGSTSHYRAEPQFASGVLGISDSLLMPRQEVIGVKSHRYFEPWGQAIISVDTVVIHHVSALNWDSDPLDLARIMAGRVSEEALRLQGDARIFSPDLCRAIFMAYGVSCHYIIDRSGRIFRLVPEDNMAFHAGKSRMPKPADNQQRNDVDKFSIGIELIGLHPDNYSKLENLASGKGYTEEQYRALKQLICLLGGRYPIRSVVGHDEIAGAKAIADGLLRTDQKCDPGPDFDWKRVRREDFSPIYSIN